MIDTPLDYVGIYQTRTRGGRYEFALNGRKVNKFVFAWNGEIWCEAASHNFYSLESREDGTIQTKIIQRIPFSGVRVNGELNPKRRCDQWRFNKKIWSNNPSIVTVMFELEPVEVGTFACEHSTSTNQRTKTLTLVKLAHETLRSKPNIRPAEFFTEHLETLIFKSGETQTPTPLALRAEHLTTKLQDAKVVSSHNRSEWLYRIQDMLENGFDIIEPAQVSEELVKP